VISFYVAQTPLGKLSLWRAPLSSLIANLIGVYLFLYLSNRVIRSLARRYPPGDPAAERAVRRTRVNLLFAVLFLAASLLMLTALFSGPRESGICCTRAAGNWWLTSPW